MKKIENILGFIVIFVVLIIAKFFFYDPVLFFRLMVGTGLGYTLARAYTGFAGSVNRAYKTGSTQLMRTLMFMFFISALMTAGLLFFNDPSSYSLWIRPINLGVILGGLFFGFGMSLSVCCASGVLTDLVSGFPRAFITLIFFGLGVFLGFPIQQTAGWVNDSWFTTSIGKMFGGGVFLPDLFKGDGLHGYLGAILFIALLAVIVTFFSYKYERKQLENNNYTGLEIEKEQEERKKLNLKEFKLFSTNTYETLFVKPWTLKEGALVISIIYVILMGVTKSGWGASTPYGIWAGKFFMLFGASAESIANFTKMPAGLFELPFFQHQISVQNFGIIVGTVIYALTAGKFVNFFTSEWKSMSVKGASLFALGGLTMGLGTRFANGCNVGALYTPIANLSLSGWLFLVAMIVGGIISNKFADKIYALGNCVQDKN